MTSELQSVFLKVFEIDQTKVDWDKIAYREFEKWDSVAHMRLINELEDHFQIMIDTDDVIGMSSYKIAVVILKRLGIDETRLS